MTAFLNQAISRFVGALARTFIIIAGLVCFVLYLSVAIVSVIAWPLLPIAPIIGLVLSLSGGIL